MANSRQVRVHSIVVVLLLATVVAYGAYLRVDGLTRTYGPVERPAWLAGLQQAVAAAPRLAPDAMAWPPHDLRADGGDPIGYLTFAKEMRGFYQAHVREPVFLAATRIMLAVTGGEDVAVSLASIVFSLGLVVATYLLGAALGSRAVGLAAALVMAVDYDVVSWSIAGWRDDASSFFCVMAAWALVRLRDRPSRRAAAALGLIAGLACLTRITSVVYLVPGLAWLALVVGRDQRRERWRQTALAAAVALLIVAPYLVNCAREFGDPLYAINYHVRFYTAREQDRAPLDDREAAQLSGAAGYVVGKFRTSPVQAVDTAIQGLTSHPFNNKFAGLQVWSPSLAFAVKLLAFAGILRWLVQPGFHVVLVVLLASLAPYMMTWPIPAGSEWRFTMQAYPFLLMAAGLLCRDALVSVGHVVSGRKPIAEVRAEVRAGRHRLAAQGAVLTAALGIGTAVAYGMPHLVARETLVQDNPTYFVAGPRDRLVLTSGWSDLTPSALARVELTSSRVDPVSRAGNALPELARDQLVGFKLWYIGVIPQQP